MQIRLFMPNGEGTEHTSCADTVLKGHNFPVGRFRCEMSLELTAVKDGRPATTNAEWSPALPANLNEPEMQQYRAGRDALYQRAANAIGGAVMLAEL